MTKLKAAQVVGIALAIGASVWFVRAGGGAGEFNPQICWIAILPATIWFGPWGGALTAVLAGIVVGPLTPLHTATGEAQQFGDWFPRLFYFTAVAIVVGLIHRRLLSNVRELEEARDELGARNRQLAAAQQEATASAEELRRVCGDQATMLAELNGFNRIDRAILSGEGEETVLQGIADLTREVMEARFSAVVELSDAGGSLELKACSGISPDFRERAAELTRRFNPSEGIVGWAIVHGRPTASANVREDPRYAQPHFLTGQGGYGYAAGVAAPIVLGGKAIGALWAGWDEEHEASPEEMERIHRLAGQAAVVIQNARQRRALTDMTFDTVTALAEAIESRDPYTGGHCARLVKYAEATARALDLPEQEVELIRYGAALHDAGKVGVSDSILTKSGPLSPAEWAELKLHPYLGGQFCKRVGFLRLVYPIIYHHHERFDGSGYPDSLSGEQIPLGARIVAIADAYDAMTSDRPYRGAMSHEEAAQVLRADQGRQWDPRLVETFLAALEGRRRADLAEAA